MHLLAVVRGSLTVALLRFEQQQCAQRLFAEHLEQQQPRLPLPEFVAVQVQVRG